MKPGIHQCSMAEYLALPYVSASLLNTLLCQSPFHAKHERDNRADDATEASDTGTAIHDALLEGVDRIIPLDYPDWRTKAAKEARAQVRADGRIPMLMHKAVIVEKAVMAAKAFIANSELAGIFDSGRPEQTILWHENPDDSMMCKCRPDWLGDEWILHVKTTQGSAQPESWIRNQLVPMGYDVAACFYERPPEMEGRQSVFLVIEQQEPHGCSLIALAPGMHEMADAKVNRALATWAQCVASGKYPAYPSRIAWAEPPNWMIQQEEEQRLGAEYDARAAEQA